MQRWRIRPVSTPRPGNYRDGNYGAGTGATVGKLLGMPHCMKSGIGSYAVQVGPLQVGAVVAVNALGDIYDWRTAARPQGLLADDGKTFLDSEGRHPTAVGCRRGKVRRQHHHRRGVHQRQV